MADIILRTILRGNNLGGDQAEDGAIRMVAASQKGQGHLPTAHATFREPTLKIRPEMPLTLRVDEAQNRPNRS